VECCEEFKELEEPKEETVEHGTVRFDEVFFYLSCMCSEC